MRIGVLGTGDVGRTLATAFAGAGHEVVLGSRSASNEAAVAWAAEHPGHRAGTFADTATHAEVIVHAVGGLHALDALASVSEGDLNGRVLLDVSNPLDFSNGMPPRVVTFEDRSLAELIQATFSARVVKALNTVNAEVMVGPGAIGAGHVLPLAGDDAEAKAIVRSLLRDLGWRDDQVADLGGLEHARGMEGYLPLWVAFMQHLGTATFNITLVTS